LIYTEKFEGIKINTNRRATLKKLNRVLNKSLIAWNAARISSEAQAPATAILQNQ
jgi:hypothetical protein